MITNLAFLGQEALVKRRTLHLDVRVVLVDLHQLINSIFALEMSELSHGSGARFPVSIVLRDTENKRKRLLLLDTVAGRRDHTTTNLDILHTSIKILERGDRAAVVALPDRVCRSAPQFNVFRFVSRE